MNIEFSDQETFERFAIMSRKTYNLKHSLDSCIMSLMRWYPYDAKVIISSDYHDFSFFFQEKMKDGRNGVCGGIIFHKSSKYNENTTIENIVIEDNDEYSIHT